MSDEISEYARALAGHNQRLRDWKMFHDEDKKRFDYASSKLFDARKVYEEACDSWFSSRKKLGEVMQERLRFIAEYEDGRPYGQ